MQSIETLNKRKPLKENESGTLSKPIPTNEPKRGEQTDIN